MPKFKIIVSEVKINTKMKVKNAQKSALRSKVFQIPIESYEKDMEEESFKEKKKEILDLFTTYNKLRSEDEFNEIQNDLNKSCQRGDLEVIKILLSETIQDSSNNLKFKIDEANQTASLFKVHKNIEELIIPRTVKHKSTEYLITSILGICYNVKTIKFSEDSAVKTFYSDAFEFSKIKEIYFPASLKELKEGWCCNANRLTKIIISPSNGQFKFIDDKYLVGKSDSNNSEFDNLLFVRRDIEKFSIPSNIKIISSYAFFYCKNLTKVLIPANSNLHTIESNAFSSTKIDEIFIPSKVSKIGKCAFDMCESLTKVEIPTNSNLQTIESYAFSWSNIESIFIPSKITKIGECAFFECENLTKVEIPTNSNLQTIESEAFFKTNIKEIYFPSSLKELQVEWCSDTKKLTKITISPSNGQFKFIDDKYLVSKSDSNNSEFDTLLFARRDIGKFSIPSNIKIISSHIFYNCKNLHLIEFPTNSNLQTIESNAFAFSYIESILIPSKVSKISECAFFECENLTKVEIPANSNLQTIESHAFSGSNIESFFIPSKVSKISKNIFNYCRNLQIIEISEESKLTSLSLTFEKCKKCKIMIPSSLRKMINTNKLI